MLLRAEDHSGARVAGLTLGLVGVGLATFGGILSYALWGLRGQATGSAYDTAVMVGVVSLGAGVVLVPVGFSLYAQNRHPGVDALPLANQPRPEPPPPEAPQIEPHYRGAGFSLHGRF